MRIFENLAFAAALVDGRQLGGGKISLKRPLGCCVGQKLGKICHIFLESRTKTSENSREELKLLTKNLRKNFGLQFPIEILVKNRKFWSKSTILVKNRKILSSQIKEVYMDILAKNQLFFFKNEKQKINFQTGLTQPRASRSNVGSK